MRTAQMKAAISWAIAVHDHGDDYSMTLAGLYDIQEMLEATSEGSALTCINQALVLAEQSDASKEMLSLLRAARSHEIAREAERVRELDNKLPLTAEQRKALVVMIKRTEGLTPRPAHLRGLADLSRMAGLEIPQHWRDQL